MPLPDPTDRPKWFAGSDASDEQRRESGPADQVQEPASAAVESATRTSRSKPASASTSTASDFTAPLVPAQFKLPGDLVQSLKLHSISDGKSMSEIVLECLTSDRFIGKAWVSTRRAA